MNQLQFKKATAEDEFKQIAALNYQTFVKEIPQHQDNAEMQLIDRFHNENHYFIATKHGQVIGMLALRTNRPFSLDEKVSDVDKYLPEGHRLCEIRLLSIHPSYRNKQTILYRLVKMAAEFAYSQQCSMGLISAFIPKLTLYQRMGFKPFAAPVGAKDACFQPMYITFNELLEKLPRLEPVCSSPLIK